MTAGQRTSGDDLRRSVAARLSEAGLDSAGAEAAELVAQLLGVEPGRLLLVDRVSEADVDRIDDAVERRLRREPLQHITSCAYFAGLELEVGPGVFIPRPETELLVEWALARVAETPRSEARPLTVVDLCSGSGALALAIAHHAPQTAVIAVELSPEAGEYLQRNIHALGLEDRVRKVRADVLDTDAIGPLLADADVVVSNPPYVPAGAAVSPEVAHDPPEAVFSGDSGMDLIDALAPILARHLRPGVPVALEHDDTTAAQVCGALAATGGFDRIRSHLDLAERPRFVSAVRNDDSGSPAPDAACVEGWKA